MGQLDDVLPHGRILVYRHAEAYDLYRTVKFGADVNDESPRYGTVMNPRQLGQLVRQHRKRRRLNLETVSAIGGFSTRFLSEFERGKETAELGKVLAALATLGLEVVVNPRQAKPPPDDHSLGGT